MIILYRPIAVKFGVTSSKKRVSVVFHFQQILFLWFWTVCVCDWSEKESQLFVVLHEWFSLDHVCYILYICRMICTKLSLLKSLLHCFPLEKKEFQVSFSSHHNLCYVQDKMKGITREETFIPDFHSHQFGMVVWS